MKKEIYIVRHTGPFVPLKESEKITFEEKSKNMILSVEAEKKMEEISKIDEFKNIDKIYSSNSARAIATAKYIAHRNKKDVYIDNRLNERDFGITYIEELPDDFIVKQFKDENYKLENGESLKEVMNRLKGIINKILNEKEDRIVLSIHGIVMMCVLKLFSNVRYNGEKFTVIFDNKVIFDELIKLPEIFRLEFGYNDDKNKIEIIEVENIKY